MKKSKSGNKKAKDCHRIEAQLTKMAGPEFRKVIKTCTPRFLGRKTPEGSYDITDTGRGD